MDTLCRYEQPQSQPVAITGSRTDDVPATSTFLEQRLLVIERNLHLLASDKQSDRCSQVHIATSPAVDDDQQPKSTPPGMRRLPDQDDGVDGMGAVTLKDGAGEDEYFGISLLYHFRNLLKL
ncbi:hypothetical protein DTO271G3_1270 [Paecilomyces variotii]|nr:hypothetical protein DTO271G3_1270 [Paecilomyces variotii]